MICKKLTQFRFTSSSVPVLGLNNWTLPDPEIETVASSVIDVLYRTILFNITQQALLLEIYNPTLNKLSGLKFQFLTPHRQPWFHFKKW